MRKFFQSAIPVGALMLIMASNSVCLGQTSTSYFLRNDALVKENAKFVADSLLRGYDPMARVPYEEAIVKAFESYWKKANVKFNWQELSKVQAQVDRLQGDIAQKDSLQKSFQDVLAKAQQLIYDKNKAKVSQADVMAYLTSRIQQMQQSSQELDLQLQQQEQLLAQRSESLKESTDLLEAKTSSDSEVSKAYTSADELLELIKSLQNALTTDILSLNLAQWEKAEDLYNTNIELIGVLDTEKYNSIEEGMSYITPYRPLIEVLNNSLVAMASKFDASRNKALSQELESLIKNGKSDFSSATTNTKLLTAEQTDQCMSIVLALVDQERASKNLNYLLDYILRENPSGIDASSYDVATDIKNIVNIAYPSQSRYNPLYVNFNSILDSLEKELKAENRSSKELKEYIQRKKEMI